MCDQITFQEILAKLNREWNARVPFFVRLYSTFQDSERLYFVMTYARNGDLLGFIDKLADSVRIKDIQLLRFFYHFCESFPPSNRSLVNMHVYILGHRLYSVLCC